MLKSINFQVDEVLYKKALKKAKLQHTTLDTMFELWLENFVNFEEKLDYEVIMKKLDYVDSGRNFTREELNER